MICAGLIGGAPGQTEPASRPVTVVMTVPRAEHAEHAEQPHTPELAETRLTGPETEILEEHVLVANDPVYGQLNGRNYLAYCATCPLAAGRGLCYGPCPGEAA